MKRLLQILVLSLVLIQLVMLPATVSATWVGAPTVTTSVSNVTPYSATLNATSSTLEVSHNNSSSLRPVSNVSSYEFADMAFNRTGYFRYGTSSGALTSSTVPIALPYTATTFSTDILGLIPCTTYYAQAFVIYERHHTLEYQPASSNYMVALFSHGAGLTGLGVGLNELLLRNLNIPDQPITVNGNIVSFTTPGCVINTGSHNAGSGTGSNNGAVGISNITVNAAAISASKVGPGEKVDITATVTNKGTVNGATSIALYINGQQVESKGITLAAGQSEPMHFFVSQNEPGTYSVQVGGVSAGSYTVDAFSNNEILIYGIIALFTIGIAGTIFMLARKRQA